MSGLTQMTVFLSLQALKASLYGVLCLSKMIFVADMLKTIPVEDLQRCYQKWEQRFHRCVAAQGNYFEEDKIDV
jgi:hypothetical protein